MSRWGIEDYDVVERPRRIAPSQDDGPERQGRTSRGNGDKHAVAVSD
jgi:hypothetical protein